MDGFIREQNTECCEITSTGVSGNKAFCRKDAPSHPPLGTSMNNAPLYEIQFQMKWTHVLLTTEVVRRHVRTPTVKLYVHVALVSI